MNALLQLIGTSYCAGAAVMYLLRGDILSCLGVAVVGYIWYKLFNDETEDV